MISLLRPLRISEIKAEVVREFKLARHDLESDRQSRDIVVPRHIAFKLSRLHTTYSFPRIGKEFCRDHTTVITGIRSVDKRLAKEPELHDRFDAINTRLDRLAVANQEDNDEA